MMFQKWTTHQAESLNIFVTLTLLVLSILWSIVYVAGKELIGVYSCANYGTTRYPLKLHIIAIYLRITIP